MKQIAYQRQWRKTMCAVTGIATALAISSGSAIGRTYEQVSPPDKTGGDVLVEAANIPASFLVDSAPSGDSVAFISGTPFAGASVGAFRISYVARRTADGWSTVPEAAAEHGSFSAQAPVGGYSDDLTKAITLAQDPVLAPDASAGTLNYFLSAVGRPGYTTLTLDTLPNPALYPDISYVGSSSDASHVVFQDSNAHTATAPAGVTNLYEWTAGAVRLVNVLPDSSPAAAGAVAGGGASGSLLNTVSSDGSKIFFTTPNDGRIYVRLDGTETRPVSQSQKLTPDVPQAATFWTATRDGSSAYFTSDEQLLDGDQDTRTDLYRYRVDDGSLELLTGGTVGDLTTVYGVIGAGDNGDSVYFVASVDDGMTVGIYLWRGGSIEAVAPTFGSSGTFAGPGQTARVSADGSGLVFASEDNLTTYDSRGSRQIYLYDADRKIISCGSCPSNGQEPVDSAVLPPGTRGSRFGTEPAIYQNSISADGRRAFFSTRQRLVPGDVNSQFDAYEIADGTVRLISSGQSQDNSFFQDASSDGSDVFFTTREQLATSDRDNNTDLYDATLNGRPARPLPGAECSGSACQPSPRTLVDVPRLGSSTPATSENAPDLSVAPVFSVKRIGKAGWRRFAATGRLRLTMTASTRGAFTAELLITHSGATVVADKHTATLTRNRNATIVLHVNRFARSVLARRGITRVRAVVRFSSVAKPVTLRHVVRQRVGSSALKAGPRKAER
ncbi:hypothetical protein [Conexibacter sp. CPCC 206217]|uniref:TolB family protein n=1 Tax=Conexibacter sp. CPCC 206217 TaxID=3064574 RepID=UPI00271E6388|nr:hypothetical protein [Conexibacter sp. CPCC 206217]MDO8213036.1 hypothetical protein [Conexibacter sp. CPCC 206217]